MSNLENQYPEQIAKEIRANGDGSYSLSIRGTARVCGVNDMALHKAFKGADLRPSKLAEKLMKYGVEGADLRKFSDTGVPDIALGIIVNYYAHDAGRYCTPEAARASNALVAVGVRTWLRQAKGDNPQATITFTQESALEQLEPMQELGQANRVALRDTASKLKTQHTVIPYYWARLWYVAGLGQIWEALVADESTKGSLTRKLAGKTSTLSRRREILNTFSPLLAQRLTEVQEAFDLVLPLLPTTQAAIAYTAQQKPNKTFRLTDSDRIRLANFARAHEVGYPAPEPEAPQLEGGMLNY